MKRWVEGRRNRETPERLRGSLVLKNAHNVVFKHSFDLETPGLKNCKKAQVWKQPVKRRLPALISMGGRERSNPCMPVCVPW